MRGELLAQGFATVSGIVVELAGIEFAAEQRLKQPFAADDGPRVVRYGRGSEHGAHAEQASEFVVGAFYGLHGLAADVEAVERGEFVVCKGHASIEQTHEPADATQEVFKDEHGLLLHRVGNIHGNDVDVLLGFLRGQTMNVYTHPQRFIELLPAQEVSPMPE